MNTLAQGIQVNASKERQKPTPSKKYITKKKVCNDFAEIQLSKFLFVGVMQRSDGELEVRGEERSTRSTGSSISHAYELCGS